MSEETDPFVPVKGKPHPYGWWCVICIKDIFKNDPSVNIMKEFPGASRSTHCNGPNFCKNHQKDKAKYLESLKYL
jgi:hypothetical protein